MKIMRMSKDNDECVGWLPPVGKLVKEFLDNVMLVSNVKLDNIPDNSETEFPSILNSSNAQQFFNVCGTTDNRLYLNPSRAKLTKLPIVSGISSKSLCCKSNALKFLHIPISSGKCSK